MKDEIVNRVAKSPLVVFDLEDYFPTEPIVFLDIKQWLWQEVILREKEFREAIRNHNWKQYENSLVALGCSSQAIVPAWATILVASELFPYAKKVVQGSVSDLLHEVYHQKLATEDFSYLNEKPVIIKGCSKKAVPPSVYVLALGYIQPWAKSVMYGEACSSVPIYKKSNV